MKQAEEYYYGRMPKDKQNVYRAMLHGLMELSDPTGAYYRRKLAL